MGISKKLLSCKDRYQKVFHLSNLRYRLCKKDILKKGKLFNSNWTKHFRNNLNKLNFTRDKFKNMRLSKIGLTKFSKISKKSIKKIKFWKNESIPWPNKILNLSNDFTMNSLQPNNSWVQWFKKKRKLRNFIKNFLWKMIVLKNSSTFCRTKWLKTKKWTMLWSLLYNKECKNRKMTGQMSWWRPTKIFRKLWSKWSFVVRS